MLLVGLGVLAIVSMVFTLYERAVVKHRQLPQLDSMNVWHSYAMSVKNFFWTNEVVQNKRMKFGNRLFTIPLLGQWCIMVKAPGLVREFYNAPEEVLSMETAAEELLQLRHIVGPQFVEAVYHIPVIWLTMNKHLATVVPVMLDEMMHAVEQEIDDVCGDKPIKALDQVTRIICRISNRVFVGLRLCRDKDYIDLTSNFSNQVIVRGAFLRFLVPPFLRSSVYSKFLLRMSLSGPPVRLERVSGLYLAIIEGIIPSLSRSLNREDATRKLK
ncbi:hypothetical protein CPB85DRAFT_809154 [Mucidula mucida]|nr:hypothetical protein CPB85DRAFT_809154 [Mucidula mucida]